MLRSIFSLVLFLSCIMVGQSQAVRRYHQSLSLSESATSLQIEAQGNVEVVNWSGSDILIEITVTTEAGSTAILNHLQKEGRYDLALNTDNTQAILVNKLTKRQPIKAKGADMDEHIKYHISIPEHISAANANINSAFSKLRK
jgi:hypothetical protein